MRFLRGFGQFWYDFLIGDDWKIAATVALTLLIGGAILVTTNIAEGVFTAALGLALMIAFVVAVRVDVRGT